jgi:hypothetical protein
MEVTVIMIFTIKKPSLLLKSDGNLEGVAKTKKT